MKTLLTALFAMLTISVLAAPPPPFFRNNYDTQACTYVFIDCRGLITANNNTSIVVNSQWNTIPDPNIASTIAGGIGNSIAAPGSDWSIIVGGKDNAIGSAANFGFVGGGNINTIGSTATFSTIGGGQGNTIFLASSPDSWSFIGGGSGNSISDFPYNVIGGGINNNIVFAQSSIITGGSDNSINPGINLLSSENTIGGGKANTIDISDTMGGRATIAGGMNNRAFSNYCAVGGGVENFAYGLAGTISGGGHNTIQTNSDHGVIGGGSLNQITNACSYSVIAGGTTNLITNGFAGVISGGYGNRLDAHNGYSVIGGGYTNIITSALHGQSSVISGGQQNFITSEFATIGGGIGNTVDFNTFGAGTIGGGYWNRTFGDFSTIPGGRENTNSSGNYSFIMGGYSNRTEGANSVVGGRAACAMADGAWFFKDNTAGKWSNDVANTFSAYFTGAGADGASIKLGVQDILATGTNRNYKGTRSDGVVTPLIGLLSDTNRIRSSGANFGVIFNNSSDSFLTRMDNNGNWGFGTNVPQAKIHILGTGTNVAVLRFANCDTNKPVTPGNTVRHLAIILDDGLKYWIPLAQ